MLSTLLHLWLDSIRIALLPQSILFVGDKTIHKRVIEMVDTNTECPKKSYFQNAAGATVHRLNRQ